MRTASDRRYSRTGRGAGLSPRSSSAAPKARLGAGWHGADDRRVDAAVFASYGVPDHRGIDQAC
jgi:hypothetical protein